VAGEWLKSAPGAWSVERARGCELTVKQAAPCRSARGSAGRVRRLW
jgi:hypothetical protein